MKNKDNEKYVKLGITGVAVIALGGAIVFLVSQVSSLLSLLNTVIGVLMPFVYGAVIAYILSPFCNQVEAFIDAHAPKLGRAKGGLAIVCSIVVALLIVAALLALVIPNLAKSILQIINALPAQMAAATEWLHNLLVAFPEIQTWWDDASSDAMSRISSWLQTDLLTIAQTLAGSVGVQFAGFVTAMKNLLLGALISVYLLANRKKFAVQARMLLCSILPQKWADVVEEEVHYADRMFNGFLVGRIVDSAIIGIICFLFTGLAGFDSAVLVSVVVGVTNIIPVFGPLLGSIPCAILLLLENPLHCLMFIIFIVILQFIDGNIIGPRIVGGATGVNSFWVLFAVILFGGLWGIVGMLVGVPLFAVIYDIVKRLIYFGLEKRGRTDLLGTNGSDAAPDAAAPEATDEADEASKPAPAPEACDTSAD